MLRLGLFSIDPSTSSPNLGAISSKFLMDRPLLVMTKKIDLPEGIILVYPSAFDFFPSGLREP